jgi:hypothetical protein
MIMIMIYNLRAKVSSTLGSEEREKREERV